jgi:hypothetical protein
VPAVKRIVLALMMAALAAGCRPKPTPSAPLESWPRPAFQPTGGKALIWYQIYGHFPDTVDISRSKYRCDGVPAGVTLENFWRGDHDKVVTAFLKQPFFASSLKREFPALAETVPSVPECTIIRGEVPDSANLDYLRDVIGLVTWFLDHGGLAALDPQTFQWYDRDRWRREVFEPNAPAPGRHVVILVTENSDTLWLHTRGLRKFARPDLSLRGVPAQQRDTAIALLNRLIEALAHGETITDKQELRVDSLPGALTCHPAGSPDDPDFNNTHIEIRWPQ